MQYSIKTETDLIQKFVDKSKRDRYITFIRKARTRRKFIDELSHFSSQLIGFTEIKGHKTEAINEKIKNLSNQRDCYVISQNNEIDGRRIEIKDAIKNIPGFEEGTLIVFGDNEVVYYEDEPPKNRWISN